MQKGKSVFVTGGTGSVGRAIVESFCAAGHVVMFQYSSNRTVAAHLEEFDATSVQVDFTSDDPLPDSDFDVIINNAGINIANQLSHEVSCDDWERTLAVNIDAPFRIIKQYLPRMLEQKWGRIINVSSIYGLVGAENNLPYNVSKHAMTGLTKTIAREYASNGITCNEICPGPIT